MQKIETCINFMSQLEFIDKIIIGINDLNNLKKLKLKKVNFRQIYTQRSKIVKTIFVGDIKYEK